MRLNFCYLKIIHILHLNYHPKTIAHILKNKQKNIRVCIHEIIRLIIMKIKMKMQNRSHRYDINRPTPRHGHKYSKYKMCLSMMMLRCLKKRLSNIWSSIYEKVNTEPRLKKKQNNAYKKTCILSLEWNCTTSSRTH